MKDFTKALTGMEKGQIWKSFYHNFKFKDNNLYYFACGKQWRVNNNDFSMWANSTWEWVADSEKQWEEQKKIKAWLDDGGEIERDDITATGCLSWIKIPSDHVLDFKNNYYRIKEEAQKIPSLKRIYKNKQHYELYTTIDKYDGSHFYIYNYVYCLEQKSLDKFWSTWEEQPEGFDLKDLIKRRRVYEI